MDVATIEMLPEGSDAAVRVYRCSGCHRENASDGVGYADLTPFVQSFIVIECAALFRSCGLRIGRERCVSDRAAQKIEGLFERAIVLFVGRHVGLGA